MGSLSDGSIGSWGCTDKHSTLLGPLPMNMIEWSTQARSRIPTECNGNKAELPQI